MSATAVLLCGHGSRDPEAIVEFERAAAVLRGRLSDCDFAIGYLEFARPTIAEGLARLATRGARRIIAISAMLFAAGHVNRDLPREISGFMAANPGVDVRLGRGLGIDDNLLLAATDRIVAVAPGGRGDALLLVVGRGTRDPDANAAVGKIARLLGERLGFGSTAAAFIGIAEPRLGAALDRAARRGFRRIVVFPYFLFGGVLVKRIHDQIDAASSRFPGVEFVEAGHLRDHAGVIGALLGRVAEAEQECRSTPL